MGSPRERPILFSASMVLALLEGRKTQTRRTIKPILCDRTHSPFKGEDGVYRWMTGRVSFISDERRCPYGVPGDRLWVRETWGLTRELDDDGAPTNARRVVDRAGNVHWVVYRASSPDMIWTDGDGYSGPSCWRPSIHIHRWASRLTLEVTAVRVERLQAITQADARAEGVVDTSGAWEATLKGPLLDTHRAGPRGAFEALWRDINGPDSWDANPWVWVVEFRCVETGP